MAGGGGLDRVVVRALEADEPDRADEVAGIGSLVEGEVILRDAVMADAAVTPGTATPEAAVSATPGSLEAEQPTTTSTSTPATALSKPEVNA